MQKVYRVSRETGTTGIFLLGLKAAAIYKFYGTLNVHVAGYRKTFGVALDWATYIRGPPSQ